MTSQGKRKLGTGTGDDHGRNKKKSWQVPRSLQEKHNPAAIESGDAGLWVTCALGKEAKSVGDFRDLLTIYTNVKEDDADRHTEDVEDAIAEELNQMRQTKRDHVFESIKIETQCVLFFRLAKPPLDVVSLTQRICEDFAGAARSGGCRYIKRISPMVQMGKATIPGLDGVCDNVLSPLSREEGFKYAIHPTIRNHSILQRMEIIEHIANHIKKLSPKHTVDLTSPERIVLVENVLGMSVVDGPAYTRLKRFNLAELGPGPSA